MSNLTSHPLFPHLESEGRDSEPPWPAGVSAARRPVAPREKEGLLAQGVIGRICKGSWHMGFWCIGTLRV